MEECAIERNCNWLWVEPGEEGGVEEALEEGVFFVGGAVVCRGAGEGGSVAEGIEAGCGEGAYEQQEGFVDGGEACAFGGEEGTGEGPAGEAGEACGGGGAEGRRGDARKDDAPGGAEGGEMEVFVRAAEVSEARHDYGEVCAGPGSAGVEGFEAVDAGDEVEGIDEEGVV